MANNEPSDGKKVAAGCAGVFSGLMVFCLASLAVVALICTAGMLFVGGSAKSMGDSFTDAMTEARQIAEAELAADADRVRRLEALVNEIETETDPARLELLRNRLAELEAEYADDDTPVVLVDAVPLPPVVLTVEERIAAVNAEINANTDPKLLPALFYKQRDLHRERDGWTAEDVARADAEAAAEQAELDAYGEKVELVVKLSDEYAEAVMRGDTVEAARLDAEVARMMAELEAFREAQRTEK